MILYSYILSYSSFFNNENLAEPTQVATSTKVITAAYEQFSVKQGKTNSKKFSIYNPDNTTNVTLTLNCIDDNADNITFSTGTNERNITIGVAQAKTFTLMFVVDRSVPTGDYICPIQVGSNVLNSEEFVIKVRN